MFFATGVAMCASAGVAFATVSQAVEDTQLKELSELLIGAFSSAEQASTDPDFFDIRLNIVRIWNQDSDGVWLYVEQAAAATLDKPYRQRVYHLTSSAFQSGDGSEKRLFISEVWMLPDDPLAFAGAHKDPSKLSGLTKSALKIKAGCDVVLARSEDGTFSGGTLGEACASERSGAAYATSIVTLTTEGMETWDRGYDAEDKQVWGSEKGAYKFLRVQE